MSSNVNIFCLEHSYTIGYTFLHTFLCSTKYQKLVFYAGIPSSADRKFASIHVLARRKAIYAAVRQNLKFYYANKNIVSICVNIPFSLELAINLNNKTSGVYYYMFVDVHNLELLRLYITVYIGTVELVLRHV